MAILYVIGTIVSVLLRIYILVLWGRFILEWILVLKRDFRPRGALAVLVESVYTVTDPPIKMFRRLLPPVRIGQIMLDLGWLLTMFSCWILLALIPGYF